MELFTPTTFSAKWPFSVWRRRSDGATSRPLIVAAAQRSGTTVFESALAQGASFHRFGEVFAPPDDHEEHAMDSANHSYFRFRSSALEEQPDWSIPARRNQSLLLDGFLRFLSRQSSKPWHIIDIKYNSWHHFDGLARYHEDAPELVRMVIKRRIPVIHLIRRNALSRACSEIIASSRREWHVDLGHRRRANGKTVIPIRKLRFHLAEAADRVESFRQYFAGYRNLLELHYEDLFDGYCLSEAVTQRLERLCRCRLDIVRQLPQKKILQNLSDEIENYDEVVEYVRSSHDQKTADCWLERCG
jgi:hypothetical protein